MVERRIPANTLKEYSLLVCLSRSPTPPFHPSSQGATFNKRERVNNDSDDKAYVDDHIPPGIELVKLFDNGWIARSLLLFLQVRNGTVQATKLAMRPTLHAVATA